MISQLAKWPESISTALPAHGFRRRRHSPPRCADRRHEDRICRDGHIRRPCGPDCPTCCSRWRRSRPRDFSGKARTRFSRARAVTRGAGENVAADQAAQRRRGVQAQEAEKPHEGKKQRRLGAVAQFQGQGQGWFVHVVRAKPRVLSLSSNAVQQRRPAPRIVEAGLDLQHRHAGAVPFVRRTKSFSVVTSWALPARALSAAISPALERVMIGEELRCPSPRRRPLSATPRISPAARCRQRRRPACRAEYRLPAPAARAAPGPDSLQIGIAMRPSRSRRRRAPSPGATGSRNGPAGIIRPLPKPVSPSTTTSDKILGQGEILVAVIHHDDVGALRVGKRRACGAVARHDGGRGMRQQQRFVAHLRAHGRPA